MGVNGLWDILRPAGQPRSLTHLAVVDGFEANTNGLRGFRIGIDASIWFYHAAYGREGENPELRTLFFRCARLLGVPFLPLFVFDGPKRPNVKRGKRITGNQHWMVDGMKRIIEAFGFEWRMAPGEAEAELAYLNSIGQIDAVLSDDVDNFLFGAKVVIRNPSATLSGNRSQPVKNADGRDDGQHSIIYKASDLESNADIRVTRGGAILIGLLRGGDYHPEGLPGCGSVIAHALARCGFGDKLLDATERLSREALPAFLQDWREDIRNELRTNSRGFLPSKRVKLAQSLAEDFPDLDILYSYTHPITSKTDASARKTHVPQQWSREPDFGKIANLCELYFEWGLEDIIIKRFRTVLWEAATLRVLRRAVMESDNNLRGASSSAVASAIHVGTPFRLLREYFSSEDVEEPDETPSLVSEISKTRQHASTDSILEYRLLITPAQLVQVCRAGIKHLRQPTDTTYDVPASEPEDDLDDDEDAADGPKKKKRSPKAPIDPSTPLRIWMPACMVRIVHPDLVQKFEDAEARRAARKAPKAPGTTTAKPRRGAQKKAKEPGTFPLDHEDENENGETFDFNVSGSEDDAPPLGSQPRAKTAARKPTAAAGAKTAPVRSKPRQARKRAPAPFPVQRSSDVENFDLDVSGSEDGAPRLGPAAQPKKAGTTRPTATARSVRTTKAEKKTAQQPRALQEEEDPDEAREGATVGVVVRPAKATTGGAGGDGLDTRRPPRPASTLKGFYGVKKSGAVANGKGKAAAASAERPQGASSRAAEQCYRSPATTESTARTTPSTASSTATSAATSSTVRPPSSSRSAVVNQLELALSNWNKPLSRTSSTASASSTASKPTPASFPMQAIGEDDDADALPSPPVLESSGKLKRVTAAAGPPVRRTRTLSESDDDGGVAAERGAPNKSPRRSVVHSSPRRRAAAAPLPADDLPLPPTPPQTNRGGGVTQGRGKPRVLPDHSVIEITSSSSSGSSGSEEDMPSPRAFLASLRRDATAKNSRPSAGELPRLRTAGAAAAALTSSEGVIDLT